METINQPQPTNKWFSFLSFLKNRRLLTISLSLLLTASLLVFLSYLFGLFQEFSSPSQPSPTPTNEATTSGKRVPSSLAIDPEFIKLEGDLNSFEQDLNSVDLTESKLSPPIIELNVNFQR